jgi:hypothetical protein
MTTTTPSEIVAQKAKEKEMSEILFFFQLGMAIETGQMLLGYLFVRLQFVRLQLYSSSAKMRHLSRTLSFGIGILAALALSTILLYAIFLAVKSKEKFLAFGLTIVAISVIGFLVNDALLSKYFYEANPSFSSKTRDFISINSFSTFVLFWAGAALVLGLFYNKRQVKKKSFEKKGLLVPGIYFGGMMVFLSIGSLSLLTFYDGLPFLRAIASTNRSMFFVFYLDGRSQLLFPLVVSLLLAATCASMCVEAKSMGRQDEAQAEIGCSISLKPV